MSVVQSEKVVVLGTGGTIAGTASRAGDNIGYTSAQVGVGQLLEAVPGLSLVLGGRALHSEQVAQVDSKDMSFAVLQRLVVQVCQYLSQADVAAVVITHGTDTLEETAYFLHATVPAALLSAKPVVLTCAMRPASSLAPDGPQNLMDAVATALTPGAQGVVVVCAGVVHGAVAVQKVHTYRTDAFDSGDAGPLGYVEEGVVRLVKNWPPALMQPGQVAIETIAGVVRWPRVEIVMNYAGASGAIVRALRAPSGDEPVLGLVVAGTGNGSVHCDLEAALLQAQADGVRVLRATRCTRGQVLPTPGNALADSKGLSPVKARVALMLALLP